jgi:hypothetical protein
MKINGESMRFYSPRGFETIPRNQVMDSNQVSTQSLFHRSVISTRRWASGRRFGHRKRYGTIRSKSSKLHIFTTNSAFLQTLLYDLSRVRASEARCNETSAQDQVGQAFRSRSFISAHPS